MRPDPLPAETMARLRKWGYAPGRYMSDCHKCGKTHSGMDKRAITCQQCAEDMEEAFEERAAVIQFGSGREMSREEAERIAQEQMGRGKQ